MDLNKHFKITFKLYFNNILYKILLYEYISLKNLNLNKNDILRVFGYVASSHLARKQNQIVQYGSILR
jgi:hypothetical protein